jgi:hypothetical protein
VAQIDVKGLCQDCAEAFAPDVDYKPIKESKKFEVVK